MEPQLIYDHFIKHSSQQLNYITFLWYQMIQALIQKQGQNKYVICFISSIFFINKMNEHALTRHYLHDFSNQTLDKNVSNGAIFFCALPILFAAIVHLTLFSRNIRINHNFFVKTYPPTAFVVVITLAGLIADVVMSVYAVINGAWTLRTWMLFATAMVLVGLAALIYTADTHATLVITVLIVVLAAMVNEWLFVDVRYMAQQESSSAGWRDFVRNLIGFNEAVLVLWALQLIGQSFVHIFKVSLKSQVILFWISAAFALIGLFVWNILSFGPFFDSIGYIIASIFLLIGVFISITFFKEGDEYDVISK